MSLIAATGSPQLATGPQKCYKKREKGKLSWTKTQTSSSIHTAFLSHTDLWTMGFRVRFQVKTYRFEFLF